MRLLLCFLFVLASACKDSGPHRDGKVIIIQPFDDLSPEKSRMIFAAIKRIDSNTILRNGISLPASAWYPPRSRYRADKLIRYLDRFSGGDTIVIGLTTKDISTTKGTVKDWGDHGTWILPGGCLCRLDIQAGGS